MYHALDITVGIVIVDNMDGCISIRIMHIGVNLPVAVFIQYVKYHTSFNVNLICFNVESNNYCIYIIPYIPLIVYLGLFYLEKSK